MPADQRPVEEDESIPDPVGSDDAIDDTADLDDEHVEIQKTISNSRIRNNNKNGDIKVQDVLPFPFLPNTRPLTVSDLDSCVALENAAFRDPAHRCSREKVSYMFHPNDVLFYPLRLQAFDTETVRISPLELPRALHGYFLHCIARSFQGLGDRDLQGSKAGRDGTR